MPDPTTTKNPPNFQTLTGESVYKPPPVITPAPTAPKLSTDAGATKTVAPITPIAPVTAPTVDRYPRGTTLVEDQARAARQGKPGYDILGDPIPGYVAPPSTAETGAGAASQYLSTFTPPKTEEEIIAARRAQAQELIDSVNKMYETTIQQEQVAGDERLGQTRALSITSGLMGAPEAASAETETKGKTSDIVAKTRAEQGAAIQKILYDIKNNAVAEAKAGREEATKSAEGAIAERKRITDESTSHIRQLSQSSSASFEDFKAKAPDEYQQLLSQNGGDDNLMKANWVLSKDPGEVISDINVGNVHYRVTRDKITGKYTTDQFTLPFAVPQEYDPKPQKLNDETYAFFPKTIDPTKSMDSQIKIMHLNPTAAALATDTLKRAEAQYYEARAKSQGGITVSNTQKEKLITKGLTTTDIENIVNDLNTPNPDTGENLALDDVLSNSGLSQEQQDAVKSTFVGTSGTASGTGGFTN